MGNTKLSTREHPVTGNWIHPERPSHQIAEELVGISERMLVVLQALARIREQGPVRTAHRSQ